MAHQVIWSAPAIERLNDILEYLQEAFGMMAAVGFMEKVEEQITLLINDPYCGRASGMSGFYEKVITKHNMLLYRVVGQQILIYTLFDTRRNPERKLG